MSGSNAPRKAREDGGRIDFDSESLDWAIARIHEWRKRVDNRITIDKEWLANQVVVIAKRGVQAPLLGFVILGCEWMFRLRISRPQDVEAILARIESRLLQVLHEDAWAVTEALAPSIRRCFKRQRVLAPEWEDVPQKAFVVTEPKSGNRSDDFGYMARLRTPPTGLFQVRRGPPPKLAPWIVGIIAERLMRKQHAETNQSTVARESAAVELISVLRGRAIDKQEYVNRRRCLEVPELDSLVARFEQSYQQFVSWHTQPIRTNRPDWFAVARTRLETFGPRETFPYELPIITKLIEAYGTSPRVGNRPART